MDYNNRKNVYQAIIAELFNDKSKIDIYYNQIIDLLKTDCEYNNILINALSYLDISSTALKLLIEKNEINFISSFLLDENDKKTLECTVKKIEEKNDDKNIIYRKEPPTTYNALTEEEALKTVFLPTDNIILPPEGLTTKIRERFSFEEDEVKKECIRTFEIDSTGKVVKYYGEKVRKIIYDDINNYYAGLLKKDYIKIEEDEL